MKTKLHILAVALMCYSMLSAEIIPVGSGSYTTTYPGADAAGRNGYPAGTPQLSGNALGKPVPTNDWWSSLLNQNHVGNLFNYPFTLRTVNAGLVVSYIPQGVIDDLLPITVGLSGLSANQCTVSDYSDWTVTMRWNDGAHQLEATAGIGMPFLYFTKNTTDVVQVSVTSGTVTIHDELLIVENAKHGADFAVYAPTGSTWTNNGGVYTSNLNGKNYWSLAFLPPAASNLLSVATEYKQYAYVFPKKTTANYTYNATTGVVRTTFTIDTDVKEGTNTKFIQGLLPHQWAHLAANSAQPEGYSYKSIRGELKMLSGNTFSVENTFHGILPTLPYVDTLSTGFSLTKLNTKIDAIKDDKIGTWTDSYNDGQLLNRLIQTARIAAEVGNTTALNAMLNTIQERLENWLKAETGEVAFIFYYNQTWSALLGYPAGHGQDSNLNDHHFHWGYMIHAAAFLEQYRPGWAMQWGSMVNMLVRDAAGYDRNDTQFPYLRSFSPYAGHCWANGFATFPNGNDQESTSESMQFNSALIHWGTITGNTAVRDLGIYLYTTEQSAIEEYWFDVNGRNFPATQQYSLVSRLWGNNFDNQTFWTGDIAASYGIELYPIHGGSLYLGQHKAYTTKLWNEIKANTGITTNQANDNLWHDVMWEYAAFVNPAEAIRMYDSYPTRNLKFGISDAQTYYWLHSMNVLGQVDATRTANYPIAAAFTKNERITYVAQNYSSSPITVTFSDGFNLQVPAGKLVAKSAGEMVPSVDITSPNDNAKAFVGEAITISATAEDFSGASISKVEFFANGSLIGTDNTIPYSIQWQAPAGTYSLTAEATNNKGITGKSETIKVTFTTDNSCSQTSNEASQGTFSTGYKIAFETVGTSVTVTSELLDTDKEGVIAYLWKKEPFSEAQMQGSNQKFNLTLANQTIGQKLELACKFAFAGGMNVTKYFEYTVGNNCEVANALVPIETSNGLSAFFNQDTKCLEVQNASGTTLQIYSITGILLRQEPINSTIHVENLSSGIYLLTDGKQCIKFVK